MSNQKRNNYSSEFRFSPIKLALESEQSISKFKNRQEVKNIIFEYIEVFYNRIRIRSSNNYLAPI
jgi:putative transposase